MAGMYRHLGPGRHVLPRRVDQHPRLAGFIRGDHLGRGDAGRIQDTGAACHAHARFPRERQPVLRDRRVDRVPPRRTVVGPEVEQPARAVAQRQEPRRSAALGSGDPDPRLDPPAQQVGRHRAGDHRRPVGRPATLVVHAPAAGDRGDAGRQRAQRQLRPAGIGRHADAGLHLEGQSVCGDGADDVTLAVDERFVRPDRGIEQAVAAAG